MCRYALQGEAQRTQPEDLLARMYVFERRLIEAFEQDARAAVVAVVTFDGVRQWLIYTRDPEECGPRIGAMPQESKPYPITLLSQRDPARVYLREVADCSLDMGLCRTSVD